MPNGWGIEELLEAISMEAEVIGDRHAIFSKVRPVGMEDDSALVWSSATSLEEWDQLVKFIERYGGDLFTQSFRAPERFVDLQVSK